MRLSIPLRKKIDLAALAKLVKYDREQVGSLDQHPYAEMLGGGWTQSKLSQLERNKLSSLTWEQGESLRLRLGNLPLVERTSARMPEARALPGQRR
jgi:hypothetical protein